LPDEIQQIFESLKMIDHLLCLLLVASPALTIPILEERQTTCASRVHIIVARASNEIQGEGIVGSVASAVVNRVLGSDSVAVVYPATLDNYKSSESQGVTAMTNSD
jgi:acetylxylan esterase